jgi:hypothetical protein
VHGARVEELLRQQAAQPLRGAAHGGRLHGCPLAAGPSPAHGAGSEGAGRVGE